jgi:hypothetical protein
VYSCPLQYIEAADKLAQVGIPRLSSFKYLHAVLTSMQNKQHKKDKYCFLQRKRQGKWREDTPMVY